MKQLRPKYHCCFCQEQFSSIAKLRNHPCSDITQHKRSVEMILITMEYILKEELGNTIKIV
jgi:hypothetical protein